MQQGLLIFWWPRIHLTDFYGDRGKIGRAPAYRLTYWLIVMKNVFIHTFQILKTVYKQRKQRRKLNYQLSKGHLVRQTRSTLDTKSSMEQDCFKSFQKGGGGGLPELKGNVSHRKEGGREDCNQKACLWTHTHRVSILSRLSLDAYTS